MMLALKLLVYVMFFIIVGCSDENENAFHCRYEDDFLNQQLYQQFYNQNPIWLADSSSKGMDYSEINFDNKARAYAWGWSYYGNSLIDMYLATGDLKYLHDFMPQANNILNQRDHLQNNISFTGSELSLPVWSDQAGYFSADKSFVYAYPVHTGVITLPMMRFSNVVLNHSLVDFYDQAYFYIDEVGKSLKAHDFEDTWVQTDDGEGFYKGHSYGEGYVTEAGKLGAPNRVFAYLASAAIHDALTGDEYFNERLIGSLNFFKSNYLNYDKDGDFYYWSYWNEASGGENWEDISHAALTLYSLHLIHSEADVDFFSDQDFRIFSNTLLNVIDSKTLDNEFPSVSKFIKPREADSKFYFPVGENPYSFEIGRWSFLGLYDTQVLEVVKPFLLSLYEDTTYLDGSLQTSLNQISNYILASCRAG